MKQLFKDVQDALDAMPQIKWVDKDKGQMNFENPPVLFPAALVSLTVPSTNDITLKKTGCAATISIKLCFNWGGNTNNLTPAANKDQSLAYYDVVDAVYKVMQGWSSNNINPLRFRGLSTIQRPDQYTTEVLNFVGDFIWEVTE